VVYTLSWFYVIILCKRSGILSRVLLRHNYTIMSIIAINKVIVGVMVVVCE